MRDAIGAVNREYTQLDTDKCQVALGISGGELLILRHRRSASAEIAKYCSN
jgi:hypothetical protein